MTILPIIRLGLSRLVLLSCLVTDIYLLLYLSHFQLLSLLIFDCVGLSSVLSNPWIDERFYINRSVLLLRMTLSCWRVWLLFGDSLVGVLSNYISGTAFVYTVLVWGSFVAVFLSNLRTLHILTLWSWSNHHLLCQSLPVSLLLLYQSLTDLFGIV
jgi:hypothetical protein